MRAWFAGRRVGAAVACCALAAQAWGQAIPACTPVTFAGGSAEGFTTSGLWHVTSTCGSQSGAHSTPYSMYYGVDGSCDFDVGDTAGEATSPPFAVQPGLYLRFNSRRGAETGEYDITNVQYSTDGGGLWTTLVSSETGDELPNDEQWHALAFALPGAATGTGTVQFRFTFETGDSINNEGLGWMVDDIQVCTAPPIGPATAIPGPGGGLLALLSAMLSLLAFVALRRRAGRA